jgi:hypothetical protein
MFSQLLRKYLVTLHVFQCEPLCEFYISWWTLCNKNFTESKSCIGLLEELWKYNYMYVDTEFNKKVY